MSILAFTTPGPSEWMLILIIVLVLFGAKKLPELARSLGQSMSEFRKAREEFDKELKQAGQSINGQPQSAQSVYPTVCSYESAKSTYPAFLTAHGIKSVRELVFQGGTTVREGFEPSVPD